MTLTFREASRLVAVSLVALGGCAAPVATEGAPRTDISTPPQPASLRIEDDAAALTKPVLDERTRERLRALAGQISLPITQRRAPDPER